MLRRNLTSSVFSFMFNCIDTDINCNNFTIFTNDLLASSCFNRKIYLSLQQRGSSTLLELSFYQAILKLFIRLKGLNVSFNIYIYIL